MCYKYIKQCYYADNVFYCLKTSFGLINIHANKKSWKKNKLLVRIIYINYFK